MGGGRNLIIIPGEKNVGSSLEDINANFSEIDTALGNKSDKGHTHNYAGSSSPGGAATSAISDSTGADISESFANVKSDIAVNKATMGCKCKNLLKSTAVTQTINGVTFTVNDDKSITVNGTATSRIVIATGKAYIQQAGNYTYTGTPSGGSSATYSMNYRSGNIYKDTDIGNGVTAQFEGGKTYEAVIDIRSGVTVSDLTFYPMLRYADITDDSYEPYAEDINTRINNIISDYLPKSGGTMNKGATIKVPYDSSTDTRYAELYGGGVKAVVNGNTWGGGYSICDTDGTTVLARFGGYQQSGVFKYAYIGRGYTDTWFKIDTSGNAGIKGSLTVNGALKTAKSGALLLSVTSESGSISGNIPGLANYTAFLVSLTVKSSTGNSYAYNQLVLPVQYIISESDYYPNVTLTFADGTVKTASIACTITGDTLTLRQQVPGAGSITQMTVYNLI